MKQEHVNNVLVQKKQVKPIKFKGVNPKDMSKMKDWSELDELAKSKIVLSLDKIVYYNVKRTKTSYELLQK